MAKSSRGKKSTEQIEDIHHEPVQNQAPAAAVSVPQVQEAEVIDDAKALELTISREIKRFNLADSAIAEMKEKFGTLEIAGIEDKAGYKTVREAWQLVRSTRTALEKKGLEIRGDYNKITKAVKTEEDRLVDAITPLEDDLYKKWKDIDDQKEAEKRRKEQEEQVRLNTRLDAMLDAGATLSSGYYGIGGTIAVDVANIRTMTDDQFKDLLGAVKNKAAEMKAEQERLAEQKRQEDEEREKEKKRLQDEADKLRKEQEDFQRQREEFENQKRETARQRREMRLDALEGLGMTISAGGKDVAYDNGFGSHRIAIEDIDAVSDADFKNLLATARERVADAKEKMRQHEDQVAQERKALEDRKIQINDVMIAAGFSYNYGSQSFSFINDFLNYSFRMDKLVQEDLGELKDKAATWAKEIEVAKENMDEKRRKQEAEREQQRQQQMGDAANFEEYINRVLNVPAPEFQSEEYLHKFQEFFAHLDDLAKKYQPEREAANA